MIQLIYREALPEDIRTIVDFQLAMALETENLRLDHFICSAGVSAVFANPSLGRFFVAARAGEVLASLLITYEWSDWRNGTIWWLQSVFVRPNARGHGVFRGLFQHVRSLAEQDLGVRGIRLYVDRQNARAQGVYRRLGMNGEHYQVFEWMK